MDHVQPPLSASPRNARHRAAPKPKAPPRSSPAGTGRIAAGSGKTSTGTGRSPIVVRGARVHNLKNVSIELPRRSLIVFTGVSGSGKSSLAFNTIYAEGQRRFVESLSAYARQFLERMDRPDVDFVGGISPSIAIEQKTTARNPRSTVGTTTEVHDYLRLLFARIGRTVCPDCGIEVKRQGTSSALDFLASHGPGAAGSAGAQGGSGLKFYVLFPMGSHQGATMKQELAYLRKRGFVRIFRNGEVHDLSGGDPTWKSKDDVMVVVDRLVYRGDPAGAKGGAGRASRVDPDGRIADSIDTAFTNGGGRALLWLPDSGVMQKFTRHYECPKCGRRFEEPDPRLFSFNNPFGACPVCQGFGRAVAVDMDLVVPDRTRTLRDGAVQPWTVPKWHTWLRELLRLGAAGEIRVDVPYADLDDREIALLRKGKDDFGGIDGFFRMVEKKRYKIYYNVLLSRYRSYTLCPGCNGGRLRPEALYIKIDGASIAEVSAMTIERAQTYFRLAGLTKTEREVALRILEELRKRIDYLADVGLGYLTLDRLSNTLSGGESQRINLATALGSSLVGALYVLDEPSIGLHQRDTGRLIGILKSLRDIGNSVIVVEHDPEIIRAADIVVDLGPGAGEGGGEIVAVGTPSELRSMVPSLTGRYLAGLLPMPGAKARSVTDAKSIVLRGASANNLKSVDVTIPLNRFVVVTGVSGSGKSSLVHDCLYAALRREKGDFSGPAPRVITIEGSSRVDAVEMVDQSPIGKTPRSNPVTYTKIFDQIRDLFAATAAARIRGLTAGSFSFNVPGGRCETCEGSGIETIEMQFLADVELPCDTCKGKRYRREVLDVRYEGKSIDEVLEMTVSGAIEFFGRKAAGKKLVARLSVLESIGMGYVRLGQSSSTLSGGESQRIKLAAHLIAPGQNGESGHTMFIFDEPTTGLHAFDIAKLLTAFERLIEGGHSVVVIEHNLEVIRCADWIIDLGPEAGERGGRVVVQGTPDAVRKAAGSHTGKFLSELTRRSRN